MCLALQRKASTALLVDSSSLALRAVIKEGGLTVTGGEQPTVIPFRSTSLKTCLLVGDGQKTKEMSCRALVLLLSIAVFYTLVTTDQ